MRIAIVNDLTIAVEALRRILDASGRHSVAWVAENGAEAVQKCALDRPDLILMDLIMPVMDGVEATRRIMADDPCAILVVTATVDGNSAKVFEALGAGALDAVNTPVPGAKDRSGPSGLLSKIEMIAPLIGDANRDKTTLLSRVNAATASATPENLVAIGASAGGPGALAEVLSGLPSDFPASVVIVQHVDEQFAPGLVDWLNQHSKMPVKVARQGDRLTSGVVHVASTSDHLVFINRTSLGYTPHPEDYVYRPSVDAFFHSVVQRWDGTTIGVLLTGMGRDGAKGLKALRDAGCHTIAQDRATSAVYGMPKAAAALGAAAQILPVDRIAPALRKLLSRQAASAPVL